MRFMLYSLRNRQRALTLVLLPCLAVCSIVFLSMLRFGLEANKLEYIELYRYVSILVPLGQQVSPPPDALPINARDLAAKLSFGRTSLKLLEVSHKDLPAVLALLGISEQQVQGEMLIIHKAALAAVNSANGLPRDLASLPRLELKTGPRVAIVTTRQVPQGSYLVEAPLDKHEGFTVVGYTHEKQKLRGEASFIRVMVLFILLSALGVQTLVTASTILFSLRSRQNEVAIIRVMGFTARDVRRLILDELAVLISAGAVLGLCGGWTIGFVLLNAVTPGGQTPFWPSHTLAYILAYLSLLLVVALVSVTKVAESSDPILVIERAETAE